jgi:hypothetical protein
MVECLHPQPTYYSDIQSEDPQTEYRYNMLAVDAEGVRSTRTASVFFFFFVLSLTGNPSWHC